MVAGITPSAVLLGCIAAAALLLALNRTWRVAAADESGVAVRWTLALIALQGLHFSEELATGLHIALPALFGQPPMPLPVFVLFNLLLIVIWLACLGGVAAGRRRVLFPIFFLCLAGIANMLAHPSLALVSGSYFPGLWTSPVLGVVAIITFRRLLNLTEST